MSDETWSETHRETLERSLRLAEQSGYQQTRHNLAIRAALAEIARLTAALKDAEETLRLYDTPEGDPYFDPPKENH